MDYMETVSSQEISSDVPEPHTSPVATSVEKAPRVVKKKGGRKGGKKRKTTRRGSKKECGYKPV